MKKLLLATILLAAMAVFPIKAMAGVDIHVGIPLPPLIPFPAPPSVVVLPDTDDVYAVPDVDADMYFWDGFWWREWDGRWYRSPYYDRGWAYYNAVPSFYFDVDPGWRGFYRNHSWGGHRWNYDRIPYDRLHGNWRGWHQNRYWGRGDRNWGVQGYRPRVGRQRQDFRQQRERQWRQRPEVQRNQRGGDRQRGFERQRQVQPQERNRGQGRGETRDNRGGGGERGGGRGRD